MTEIENTSPHQSITYADTETTSLSAEHGKIWEFAGIRYDFLTAEDAANEDGLVETPFGPARETCLEIQIDQSLADADVMSLRIGHYHERFGKQGFWEDLYDKKGDPLGVVPGMVLDPLPAAVLIEKFLRDSSLMGITVNFDHERLERFLRWEDQCPAWHYHPVDVKTFAAGVLIAKGHTLNFPWLSTEIREKLGVEEPAPEVLHTALGDAIWTRDAHWNALRLAQS